jgi:hypothetical protein
MVRHRARGRVLFVVALALVGCNSAGTPAPSGTPTPATTTKAFKVTIPDLQFASYKCRNAAENPCRGLADAHAAGPVTADIAGVGKAQYDYVVDYSDAGPDGRCNTVDETGTLTFAAGTISVRSLHRDCNFTGPRIQTLFVVTAGTGEFAGASGYGTEISGMVVVLQGTITYAVRAASPS